MPAIERGDVDSLAQFVVDLLPVQRVLLICDEDYLLWGEVELTEFPPDPLLVTQTCHHTATQGTHCI